MKIIKETTNKNKYILNEKEFKEKIGIPKNEDIDYIREWCYIPFLPILERRITIYTNKFKEKEVKKNE